MKKDKKTSAESDAQRLVRELEAHQAELERENEELRLQATILSQVQYGINLVRESDLVIIYTNPRFEEMFGYSPGELVGKNVTVLNDPGECDPRETADEIVETVNGEGVWKGEIRNVKKDGTRIWCQASVGRIKHADQGNVFVSVHRDVTEHKRAEEAARAAEARYRGLFSHIDSGVAVYTAVDDGADYVFADFNDAACRIDSIRREEVIGRRVTEVFPGVREFGLLDVLERVYRTGAPEQFPVRQYKDDRITGWRESYVYRIPSGEVVAVYRDLTEEKRAEEALRESEEKYRGIFENIQDVYFEVLLDGTILDVSPSIEIVSKGQYHRDDLIGKSMYDFYRDPVERDRLLEVLQRSGKVTDFEVTLLNRDGSPFTCAVSSIVMFDSLGRPAKITGSMRDITERKRLLQERESLQACLAQADRLTSMGTLAASVSHEINNPLTYVLYNIESLAADIPKLAESMRLCRAALTAQVGAEGVARTLGAEHETFSPAAFDDAVARLREALEGVQRIKRITRSLSTFSRVERNDVMPVNVQTSIKHALTMASNEIKYRARITRDFGAVPAVLASEGQLAQVFLNLLINAAQAIGEGDVEGNEIRVRTWTEGDRACVEVRDTGTGIEPEHMEKIFEPFFTTKDVGVGSGLGLSICKNIIGSLGGEIDFESE
ncbi:MAG TPA: PAS domain S-box protein, partial [Polyangia bacterium]|nr:PAS domain S-box protein [Polyangia bacterium]